MKISINNTKITKYDFNRVSSESVYVPHLRKNKNLNYDENGIFSKRIFGRINKCECGKINLTKEKEIECTKHDYLYCEECGTRVVNKNDLPDFYIDLKNKVTIYYPDYVSLKPPKGVTINEIMKICKYEAFLLEEEIIETDDDFDYDAYSDTLDSNIYIGEEALKHLGVSQDWIDENMVDYILIPHTIYRPMIMEDTENPYVTDINKLYIDLIRNLNAIKSLDELKDSNSQFYFYHEYKNISAIYERIIEELFVQLQDANFNIIKSEIISHPISGAIRATLINRHDIHEDVLLIGDTLIKTLYPYLYKHFNKDMFKINKFFVENDFYTLLYRDPIIAHLSVLAFKPRVASVYPLFKTEGTDRCLLHNERYEKEVKERIYSGLMDELNENGNADIASSDCQEEIDYLSLDCITTDAKELNRMSLTIDQIQFPDTVNSMYAEDINYGDIERYIAQSGKELYDSYEIDTLGLRCIAINPIVADGPKADFDGDVLLAAALYSRDAINEAKLMSPSKAYLNFANGKIRNHIIDNFFYPLVIKGEKEEELRKIKNMDRDEYFEENQRLSESLWTSEYPTIYNILNYVETGKDSLMSNIFTFFDDLSEEDFRNMANQNNYVYDEENSLEHLKKVEASNNSEIKSAGTFYKLAMASGDDLMINENNCGSKGKEFTIFDSDGKLSIDEETYNYKIRSLYVEELKGFSRTDFDDFMEKIKEMGLNSVHVRSPLTCNNRYRRCFCKKCAGMLPPKTKRIGAFSALMITESATQACLSAMNKGVKENINGVLNKYYDGKLDYESIDNWIGEVVDIMCNPNVSSRFYEITLLSRVHTLPDGKIIVSSLDKSINYSNLFGAYIFKPTPANFKRIIDKKSFEDTSLKLKIAMNNYNEDL